MFKKNITEERLKELFYYDPLSGEFTRKKYMFGAKKNKVGNVRHDGYKRICIDYVSYLAHRLAWLYMTGEMPDDVIDHIDGNPSNNAFHNLRKVSQKLNVQNVKTHKSNSIHKCLGVSFHNRDKLWRARLYANGKQVLCKYFKNKEDAEIAYIEAKRKFHEGCLI